MIINPCPDCGSLNVKFTGRLRVVRQASETNVIVVVCDCYICRVCLEEWADFEKRRDKIPA